MTNNNPIALVGCGAIGSSLAASLIKNGSSNLDLIDPDKLSIENIARHYCGMSDIGINKANALSRSLRGHFPNIKSNAYPEDILHLLLSNNNFLNKYGLNIISIANFPVEKRINELLTNKSITSPTLFVWVEPLLVAGHAIFVNPASKGCFECAFNNQLNFKYTVVENSIGFIKREAGCQTSFVPYGTLEIDLFTNSIMRFIISIINGYIADNTLLTWIGDIDNFRMAGNKVTSQWESAAPYSEHQAELIDKNCTICQN